MQNMKKPLNSVLVKPAGPDCNMACTYCFYLEKEKLFTETKVHRMTDDLLHEMVRQVMKQAGAEVSFGWQGGEPTLMGLSFFEKAVEYQQKYGRGQSVGNGLQTNGVLIDDKWSEFLCKYNFLVGLSLDGPEHIHDRYRKMQGGGGSWQKVHDSAKRMLDHDVAVNALSVVNNYSVKFPEEIYHFHKELGLNYMQFIPCLETDLDDPTKPTYFSAPAEDYGHFLCKVFDLWMDDFDGNIATTSVRYFDSVFYSYVGMHPPACTLLPTCGVYVIIEHNGDVYSCDFFVDPEWKLGNIMSAKISEMLNSGKQTEFGNIKARLPMECEKCHWLRFCYGDCPKDRLGDPTKANLNYFCQSYKIFYEYADERLRNLAEKWKQDQQSAANQYRVRQAVASGQLEVGRNDPCPCGSGLKFKKCCGRDFAG